MTGTSEPGLMTNGIGAASGEENGMAGTIVMMTIVTWARAEVVAWVLHGSMIEVLVIVVGIGLPLVITGLVLGSKEAEDLLRVIAVTLQEKAPGLPPLEVAGRVDMGLGLKVGSLGRVMVDGTVTPMSLHLHLAAMTAAGGPLGEMTSWLEVEAVMAPYFLLLPRPLGEEGGHRGLSSRQQRKRTMILRGGHLRLSSREWQPSWRSEKQECPWGALQPRIPRGPPRPTALPPVIMKRT